MATMQDTNTNPVASTLRIRPEEALRRAVSVAQLLLTLVLLAGCSGGTGAGVEEIPFIGAPPVSNYAGPPPATADVQSFRINLWDNIQASNRCGSCHSVEGGQAPLFARRDDINLAYAQANTVVMLTSPQDSRLVVRVGSGHNCWLASDGACADIMTTWITNWAGALAIGGSRTIELEPPPLRDPGESRSFPADPALFQTTVYPLLEEFCSACHASSAAFAQSPFLAEGPAGNFAALQTAYEAAKPRINLDDPAVSRLVVRLRDEQHNCWSGNCTNDAAAMQAAIQAFAQNVLPTPVDPTLVTSKALTLYEGTIASGGNRYEANVIALYEFKTGIGNTAYDTSGVEPAMDLTLSGAYEWFGGWGVSFSGGKAQAAVATSAKLRQSIVATGEYSIEAWVIPGNVVQEDARIVSYSGGIDRRNFNLGQTMYDYDFFNRSSNSDANGSPQLSTPSAQEVLQATQQHVVATFDPVDGRRIYVNGTLVASLDPTPSGTLADWDDTFAFVLGNEVSSNRSWHGVARLVAIHNRALTPEQVGQNFEAGVGERFYLLFSVEHLIDVPASYIVFEAAQFDTHAYLFREPFFISLDASTQPGNIDLEGIRIGINGSEVPVGQTYARLDTLITNALYDPETGQPFGGVGAVLPLEKGPDADEFFLSFDRLGGNVYTRPAPVTPPAPAPQDLPPASQIGVRTFDAINAAMATLTGVPRNNTSVGSTHATIRQSLPAVSTIEAFLASHQVAIAQLAIEYCNVLIDDTTLRASTFPGFDFTAQVSAAFPGRDSAASNSLIEPLLDRMLGTVASPIATQPDRADAKGEIENLIYGIPGVSERPGLVAGGDSSATRTRTIAKAACAAMLGSAAMLVH
jgi:hypothetical protein